MAFHAILKGKRANTACSGQQGLAAFSKPFSGFELFPFRQRIQSRPAAANASRWAEVPFRRNR